VSEHAHAHHRNYVKIWAILVGLLVVSIIGPMTGIRVVMLITAFGIALVKAYMVAKNFMHLDVEKPIVHWMMGIALIFMVMLFVGVAPDVMKDHGRRWVKGPGFHPVERVGHEGGGEHAGPPHEGAGIETGHQVPAGEAAPTTLDSAAAGAHDSTSGH